MNPRKSKKSASSAFLLIMLLASCNTPIESTHPFERKAISTEEAPAAAGPYSQAIQVGNMLFLAGQVGLDPDTRTIVEGGIEAETRQAMSNLDAVLQAAGFSMSDVVQAQVFLADINDYATMNAVYGAYFADMPPGRAAVQVARLPLDARVEILMTAVKAD